MKIQVEHLFGDQWNVVVQDAITTDHCVRVTDDDLKRFGAKNVTPGKLIEESFHSLLERESNTSILRTFELSIISRYFPEYEREIRRRIAMAQ